MPDKPPLLLGFYGDEFTGSIAALDALTVGGVPAVLFTRPPTADDLAEHPGVRAFGVAGRTRGMTAADTEGTLRLAFEAFRDAGDFLIHYVTCGRPEGLTNKNNIGRVIAVGLDVFGGSVSPPVVTTADRPSAAVGNAVLAGGARFVIGSAVIETALCAAWTEQGLIQLPPISACPAGDVGPVVVVCGSRSPASAGQIRHAIESGFAEVIISPNALDAGEINNALMNAVVALTHALGTGRSVVLHTDARHHVAHTAADDARLGTTLGHALRLALLRRPVRRVAVVGTDTSGRVAAALGVRAITVMARLTSGTPLCLARAKTAAIDGLQMVFKAGPAGAADFFTRVGNGHGDAD